MQLYYQDKAIEYNAICKKLENKIKALREIKIDVDNEEKRFQEVTRRCNAQLSAYTTSYTAGSASQSITEVENIYQRGIDELNKVFSLLKRHDLYFDAYRQALSLEEKINDADFTKSNGESEYSSAVIMLLKTINSSDTRPFHTEENVIKKIYDVAYEIIKMELLQSGNSKVLLWVKEDEVASSFIADLIRKELEELKASSNESFLSDVFDDIASFSISSNCLNEELILFLALQNGVTKKKVEEALALIVQEMFNKKGTQDKMVANIEQLRNTLVEIKERIKGGHIYKELGIMLALVGVLFASKYGIDKLITKVGHTEYRTYPDYYTNVEGEFAPTFPEYMQKIKGFESVELTAYSPWVRSDVFYGDYERQIRTYDLTKENIGELEDALNLDFPNLRCDIDTETRSDIDSSELYTDAIIEILRLKQDESDNKFIPHEEDQALISVITTIVLCVLGCVGEGLTIFSLVSKIKEKLSDKRTFTKHDKELITLLENYRSLCEQNEGFRNRFIEMYERVSKYCESAQLNNTYKEFKEFRITPLETLQDFCDID